MSRTYKHMPLWLAHHKYGVEKHDHRNGKCTLDSYDSKLLERDRENWRRHYLKCNKWVSYTIECSHHAREKFQYSPYDYDSYKTLVLDPTPTHREVFDKDGNYLWVDELSPFSKCECDLKVDSIGSGNYDSSEHLYTKSFFRRLRYPDRPCACDTDSFMFYGCHREIPDEYHEKFFTKDSYYTEYWIETTRTGRNKLRNALNNYKNDWNSGYSDEDDEWDATDLSI